MKVTDRFRLLSCITVACFFPGLSKADVINGGFETGSLSGWKFTGKVTIETDGSSGISPPSGIYQAFVESAKPGDYGIPTPDLELFLGISPGTLNALGKGSVTQGSAIQQTFSAHAGDILSLSWNFLTDEATPEYNDFAFISILPLVPSIRELSDTMGNIQQSNSSLFLYETGYSSISYAIPLDGVYTLSIGVVDVGDEFATSGLFLDQISLTSSVPEPSGVMALTAGLITLGGAIWYRRRNSIR